VDFGRPVFALISASELGPCSAMRSTIASAFKTEATPLSRDAERSSIKRHNHTLLDGEVKGDEEKSPQCGPRAAAAAASCYL
jgi:hypothetical protein